MATGLLLAIVGDRAPVRYAILDRSGWLGDAVRRRIVALDVATFLDAVERAGAVDPLLAEALAARTDDFEADAMEMIHALSVESGRLRSPEALHERFAQWWMDHPEAVLDTAPEVSFARFVEVHTTRPFDQLDRLLGHAVDGYIVIPEDSIGTDDLPRYLGRRKDSGLESWYVELAQVLIARQRRLEEGTGP